MHSIRRFRIPALFCALAVLICELIARPYANTGICDDWSYILSVQKLATTGHIVYVGWSAAMLGWQLYLGAALVKLFGFSITTVRMSTLLVAMVLAFILQRILVRSGITERNATIGTLALVLSPLYLMLSVTFMSDIHGLFAIVLCLYGCLRGLQSSDDRAAIGWLCFAVATNAICGTSRQLAWLGVLVMVPSTLWLLRGRRRVLWAGMAATIAGIFFILVCMHWLKQQPYTLPEHVVVRGFPVFYTLHELFHFFLDIPFLLLPIVALFLPQIRKSRARVIVAVAAIALGYVLLVVHQAHLHHDLLLEPTVGDWVNVAGGYGSPFGPPPIFFNKGMQIVLTIASIGGLLGVIACLIRPRQTLPDRALSSPPSWGELGVILVPFTVAYILLLASRAVFIASDGTNALLDQYRPVIDRYALGLLVVALLCLIRLYQERIQPRLPVASILLVALTALCGVALTHNMFALYRARVDIAAELNAAGVPETSFDNGWEHNMRVELEHSDHINDPTIEVPAHAYVFVPPPTGVCSMAWYGKMPHIHPLYGIADSPNACDGPAPFAPVTYSRWLASSPITLYVVRYTDSSKP